MNITYTHITINNTEVLVVCPDIVDVGIVDSPNISINGSQIVYKCTVVIIVICIDQKTCSMSV